MLKPTNKFKHLNLGQGKRDYLEKAEITLEDGTKLEIGNGDIWNGGISIEDAVSGNDNLEIGSAIINKCDITLININDEYTDYDFTGAEVIAYIGLALDTVDESVGRNLLIGSDQYVTENKAVSLTMSPDTNYAEMRDEKLSISVDIDLTDATASSASGAHRVGFSATLRYVNGSTQAMELWQNLTISPRTLTTRMEKLITVRNSAVEGIEDAAIQIEGLGAGTAKVGRPKLAVEGYVTPWSIAPEDIQTEYIRKGTYDVADTKYNGSTITLSCYDRMARFDKSYSESKLQYPASLDQIIREACSTCVVVQQTYTFPHNNFVVQTRPVDEAVTFREVVAWVAQIAGCFCRCDVQGRLELKWYDLDVLENPKVVDWRTGENLIVGTQTPTELKARNAGTNSDNYNYVQFPFTVGKLQQGETYTVSATIKFTEGSSDKVTCILYNKSISTAQGARTDISIIDGRIVGTITVTGTEAEVLLIYAGIAGSTRGNGMIISNLKFEQGTVEEPVWTNAPQEETAHWIRANYSSPTISTDDVVVTGVKVIEKNDSEDRNQELTTYQTGKDGYVISIENNELIKNGAGRDISGWIGEQIIGMRFRKASMNHPSNPTMEAGDIGVLTDRKGVSYPVILSSTKFSTGSAQSTVSSAQTPARNSAARYSAETKNYVEWRKAVQREKTQREQALEDLSQRLDSHSGLYTTTEAAEGGGSIFYLHDKPALNESSVVWKMTAEAWGVSTDGGKHWNGGMTVDGDTIVRILTATGISADWIDTGSLVVKKGDKVVFLADVDTGQVQIVADSFSLSNGDTIDSIADSAAAGALSSAKSYADTSASSTLASAKTYADTSASSTLASAKTYADSTAEAKAKAAVEAQTQEQIFSKLTNGGKLKGLFMEGNELYMNASYIKTGTFKVMKGTKTTFSANATTGEVIIVADEFSLSSGATIDSIAKSEASSAASGALSSAKSYTDTSASNTLSSAKTYADSTAQSKATSAAKSAVDDAMTQQNIFNKLTNNGQEQGIKLSGGKIYINATYINTGTLSANYIKGGILTLGGSSNINGSIKMLNSSGAQIGLWDNNGFQTVGRYFSVDSEGAMFSNNAVAVDTFRMCGAGAKPAGGGPIIIDTAKQSAVTVMNIIATSGSSQSTTGTYRLVIGGGITNGSGGWTIKNVQVNGGTDGLDLVGNTEITGNLKVTGSTTLSGPFTGSISNATLTDCTFNKGTIQNGTIRNESIENSTLSSNVDVPLACCSAHGNAANTALGTVYFKNNSTTHVGRVSCYSSGSGDYTQLGLVVTSDSSVENYFNVYGNKTTTKYDMYINSSTKVTSDRRMKLDFDSLDRYEKFFELLEPQSFRMTLGQSGRVHTGFVAQQVEEALEEAGISTDDFAALTIDKPDVPYFTDMYGYVPKEFTGVDYKQYYLAYQEFIALNTHMIQKLMKRVDELEATVRTLKGEA